MTPRLLAESCCQHDAPPPPPALPRFLQALNWYTSVRVKLDDPKYSTWFIKFRGYSDSPYPGGPVNGKADNGTFHVPTCDFYNNGTQPRCSGFYHDQEQTPEHPGGGSLYPVSRRAAHGRLLSLPARAPSLTLLVRAPSSRRLTASASSSAIAGSSTPAGSTSLTTAVASSMAATLRIGS